MCAWQLQLTPFHLLPAQAVWMYTCLKHRFVDERRKDYFVMYLHHIVTIALVGTYLVRAAVVLPARSS